MGYLLHVYDIMVLVEIYIFRKYIFVCRWNITGTFISPELGRFEGEKERIGGVFVVVFLAIVTAYADIPGIMLLSKI